jgi:hypothetical protein
VNGVLGCIGREVMRVVDLAPENTVRLAVARGQPTGLSSSFNIAVRIYQTINVESLGRGFESALSSYGYSLRRASGGEILAYHWHPATPVARPHLHVSAAWGTAREFSRVHLPTGHVSLAEFALLLIREFAVVPQRSNWRRVLVGEVPAS